MYKTLADYVGGTPLVRLTRLPGAAIEARGNVILAKLEGNNPAGSVKDRPALSMIQRAAQRGDIKPGDTLIEATSGNTGIALAMAAAMGLVGGLPTGLKGDPARDAQRLTELRPLDQRYTRRLAELKGVLDARTDEFRWLLEELRISLFAQELKTPVPVSVKRLQKQWEGIQHG